MVRATRRRESSLLSRERCPAYAVHVTPRDENPTPAGARARRGRGRIGTTVALAALALVLVTTGVLAAAWLEAKALENDSLMCSFGMLRTDDGVLVRDDPVGKVCVYLDDGRLGRIAPMACVEGKLDFETRGCALLDVRKTPTGFRRAYHDAAGNVLRVRNVEER